MPIAQKIKQYMESASSWPFLLAVVYGVLIAMNAKTPVISSIWIWLIVIGIAAGCWAWSSVIWLHEQGIRIAMKEEPTPPVGPPQALEQAAAGLPKFDSESRGSVEDA